MHSSERHNPPESSTLRTLGHIVKISKSFCFSPCIFSCSGHPLITAFAYGFTLIKYVNINIVIIIIIIIIISGASAREVRQRSTMGKKNW